MCVIWGVVQEILSVCVHLLCGNAPLGCMDGHFIKAFECRLHEGFGTAHALKVGRASQKRTHILAHSHHDISDVVNFLLDREVWGSNLQRMPQDLRLREPHNVSVGGCAGHSALQYLARARSADYVRVEDVAAAQ